MSWHGSMTFPIHASMNSCPGTGKPTSRSTIPSPPEYARVSRRMITLRRTISAIFWRHQNGAKWRAIPDEFGPWCITHTCSFDGRNSVCASTSLRRSKTGIRDILSALS
ncbi:transposase [Komagataeibacter oboediens]|uniref:transposase n=1 Tax=Komagataeibacter oboediens TaxID=65958 RepID=UPI000D7C09C5